VDAILEALLLCKALISFSELDVWDVRVDLFVLAREQAVIGMIVAVGGEFFSLEIG
jgi:hypothetical protein